VQDIRNTFGLLQRRGKRLDVHRTLLVPGTQMGRQKYTIRILETYNKNTYHNVLEEVMHLRKCETKATPHCYMFCKIITILSLRF
jgi:hypothetical protein